LDKKHSISVISDSCGVKTHTIRAWEKRYNLFSPQRSSKGQRLYGDEDIVKAKLIVSLINCGYSVSSLAIYSVEELDTLKSKMTTGKVKRKIKNDSKKLKKILNHLNSFNIDAVASEIQFARLSMGVKSFIMDLVLPVIRECGQLVNSGNLSVTQEHIVSTIIRDQLSQIYLANSFESETSIALATPLGNIHELSILIADLLCRVNRLPTRYLGVGHPAPCLAEALGALKIPILVLGVISSSEWSYEDNIITYLTELDSLMGEDLVVVLGGGQQLDFPKFKYIKIKILNTFEEFDEYLEVLIC
jgi:MerR family transcriptional regulator, light-induced transcriptional regulator